MKEIITKKIIVAILLYLFNISFSDSYNVYCNDDVFSIAVNKGDIEMVKSLVEYGANVNYSENNFTPLTRAILRRHAEIVKYLIDKGADVNKIDNNGNPPLIYAIAKPHDEREFKSNSETIEIVNLLLSKGASVHSENKYEVPMLALVSAGDISTQKVIMKSLIDHGANVNGDQQTGNTPPIVQLSCCNNVEKISFLIENGANINAKTRFGETALMKAAHNSFNDSNYELILYLMKNKVDPTNVYIRDGNPKTKILFEQYERYRTIKNLK